MTLAKQLTYKRRELNDVGQNNVELDNKEIENVAERIAKKVDIPIQKAKQELGMGVLLAIMMNRHRAQDINDGKEEKNE